MAEFTEVMRQARRMCEAFRDGHCSDCPIGDAEALECGITVTAEMDCEEVERRVMQWAEEHPEPVYPSWRKWYDAAFPEAIYRHICPATFGDEYTDCGKDACGLCVERTIPADIAAKLGIKPITLKEG